jgi:CotH kinase protein/Lamin Tail Domain/Fn3 associated
MYMINKMKTKTTIKLKLLFLFVILVFSMNSIFAKEPIVDATTTSKKSKSFLPNLSPRLHISEVVASNLNSYITNGESYDWIELFNNTSSTIDLANYYMSDSKVNFLKFRFPSTPNVNIIPAGGFLIILASSLPNNGPAHTNFSLSQSGEFLSLLAPDGLTMIDSLTFSKQRTDVSYGLNYTADNVYNYFKPPSPGTLNNLSNAYIGILESIQFSNQGGFFNQNFNLFLVNPNSNSNIIYTTDGSDPNENNVNQAQIFSFKNSFMENPGDPTGTFLVGNLNSHLYSSPLQIQNRTITDNNKVSNFASSFHNIPPYLPDYNLSKATIVRAIAVKTGYLSSEIVSNSYFINATGTNPYAFPVISFISSEKNLFDYNTGIYTAGNINDGWRNSDPLGYGGNCSPGNYQQIGDNWEKDGNFEFIENQTSIINDPIKVRIHGGCSTTFPLKTLRFESQNKFNNHAFFSQYPTVKHDRILTRNSGNDFYGLMFRDVFIQNLVSNQNFEKQKSKPSVFFLNGEYYGILNIRERYDKYYFKNLYNTPLDSIDIVEVEDPYSVADYGDNTTYEAFKSLVLNNPMFTQSDFGLIENAFDQNSLIDYQVTETFIGNGDWPNNNVKVWRKKIIATGLFSNNPNDGRFRWMLFDTDFGLGLYHQPNIILFSYLINRPGNELFKKLLDNQSFTNKFLNKYADNLNSIFKPLHSVAKFTVLKTNTNQ